MNAVYERYAKRGLDILLASIALLVLLPLLAIIAAMIRLEDGGRVIFRQQRVGRDRKPFALLKFRSMRENVGDIPSSQAARLPVTRIGQFIRRTNLDELPQLVNIIRGEMSIVGPRPALPSQGDVIEMRARLDVFRVRPGLTGLAQVSSYDGMLSATKVSYDEEYSHSVSLIHDIMIIWRTFGYLRHKPPVY